MKRDGNPLLARIIGHRVKMPSCASVRFLFRHFSYMHSSWLYSGHFDIIALKSSQGRVAYPVDSGSSIYRQMKPSGQRRFNNNATQLASSKNAFWNQESERALAIGGAS